MGRMEILQDQGTVFTQTGSSLLTAYVAGTPFFPQQSTRLGLFVYITGGGATTFTSANVQCKISYDGNNFVPIQTVIENTTGASSATQNIASPGAGNTSVTILQTGSHMPAVCGVRVDVQLVGTAGVNGDIVTVFAVAM